MARRSSEVELCFDSMTDLITNLAGGLILVVMLLIGLTREAPKTLENRPAAGTGKQNDSEKSTRALGERLNNLQVDTARVNIDITSDEQLLRTVDLSSVGITVGWPDSSIWESSDRTQSSSFP